MASCINTVHLTDAAPIEQGTVKPTQMIAVMKFVFDDHSVGDTRARDAFADQLGDLATKRRPDRQYADVPTDMCEVRK